MKDKMFCYQCQEANKNIGCTVVGVCGKSPLLADHLDVLKETIKSLAVVRNEYVATDKHDEKTLQVDIAIENGLFKMITNANFDNSAIEAHIEECLRLREALKAEVESDQISSWSAMTIEQIKQSSYKIGTLQEVDEDIRSLKEFIYTGLMGMAAYTSHARNLGYTDQSINDFIASALEFTLAEKTVADYLPLIDQVGKFGLVAMELLDKANTTKYGNPVISKVKIGVGTRPGILISGHDLSDLEQLLEQAMDKEIDIYTHSEMLPAHAYPQLAKYPNLYGNYGGAWHAQRTEFEAFNGPILFTTNCIVPPLASSTYKERVFTTGNTGFPGFKYIEEDHEGNKDFSQIIEMALNCQPPESIEEGQLTTGFAHNQVIELADAVIENITSGAITDFVVMAGCDGRQPGRSYYTEFAEKLPDSAVILTAGCAKYRYNKLNLGDINGIPRVLDAGQCNDSYSLVKIALTLTEVLGLDNVNQLPITYNIAWYEQKAVIVLLTLLHLGIENIHLGPTLPAFVSPNVAKVLIDTYKIGVISDVDSDLQKFGLN